MSDNEKEKEYPHLDTYGLKLDIGDFVQFAGDEKRTARLFQIYAITLDGKCLIRSGSQTYAVEPHRLAYVWVPNLRSV